MDYQIVCATQLFVALLACGLLNSAYGIIGRDLLLTPKEGLQLSGRSIYYEEDSSENVRNQSVRPWERTLKHVIYVTLFTNNAADAAAGNLSKLKEYNDFLQSPYIEQAQESDSRFGDIVSLASGFVEEVKNTNNGTTIFRFIEGRCDYECAAERVWALWQVQKIRHRDANRKYRYEMKFSVSPLRTMSAGGNIKRKVDENNYRHGHDNALQTYIQKDDDYPKNFGRIVYSEEANFADRRLDDTTARKFRPTGPAVNDYRRQATPMPESTFMHAIFQPHPHYPPRPQKLNLGEYIKDYAVPAKATPKIELFPNVLNMVGGVRNHYAPAPTTYRPNYQVKFGRPEFYRPQQETPKYAMNAVAPPTGNGKVGAGAAQPLVTHHFHHHFYMPSQSSEENGLHSGEQQQQQLRNPINALDITPTPYYNSYGQQESLPPAPQKIYFPTTPLVETEPQQVVHVTPVPVTPLRRPQIQQTYATQTEEYSPHQYKIPQLLIYPAPVNEQQDHQPTTRHKPFVQSEQYDASVVHYSEPDPLYLNEHTGTQSTTSEDNYEQHAPQLETPKHAEQYTSYARPADSIAAQLPPPDKDQDVRIPYVDESEQPSDGEELTESKPKNDLQQISSQKKLKISTEKTTASTAQTVDTPSATLAPITTTTMPTTTATTTNASEPTTTRSEPTTTTSESVIAAATVSSYRRQSVTRRTTTTTPSPTLATTTAAANDLTTATSSPRLHNFVGTSTSESPLRAASRYRTPRTTSTTERPVLKWKPRRKTSKYASHDDNKAKGSLLHEERVPQPEEKNSVTVTPSLSHTANDIFQVLTQRSVSKSVSIKVGADGEEIPIIIDDRSSDTQVNEIKQSVETDKDKPE